MMSKIDELIKKRKLKKAEISIDMCLKEFNISYKDLQSAKRSFEDENYKWATIQAYYAVFHAVRCVIYKSGYREESHSAMKTAFKELYIETGLMPVKVFLTLERGMDLREMADYKETFSRNGADLLIHGVEESIRIIEEYLQG